MLSKTMVQVWMGSCTLLCALLWSNTSLAGIPVPCLTLRGKVLNTSDVQRFSGTLQWTFTLKVGGDPVTVSAPLQNLPGEGGPYCYQVMVPLETRVSGSPENAKPFAGSLIRNFRPATSKLGHSIAAFEGDASDAT